MPKTIILIDDEREIRTEIAEELAEAGFAVVQAENGAQGLRAITKTGCDLIICDRVMPVMSGYALLEELRHHHPQYDQVPFVFLTGLGDPRDRKAVAGFHLIDYWTKPLDLAVVVARVRALLARPA